MRKEAYKGAIVKNLGEIDSIYPRICRADPSRVDARGRGKRGGRTGKIDFPQR